MKYKMIGDVHIHQDYLLILFCQNIFIIFLYIQNRTTYTIYVCQMNKKYTIWTVHIRTEHTGGSHISFPNGNKFFVVRKSHTHTHTKCKFIANNAVSNQFAQS